VNCTVCGADLPEGAMFCGECGRATTGRPNARPTQLLPDGEPMTVAPRDTVVIDRDWLSAEFDSDPIMRPAGDKPTAVAPPTPDAAPPRTPAPPSRSPWDVPAWPAMPGSFTDEPAPQTTAYTRAPWAQPAARPVAEPVEAPEPDAEDLPAGESAPEPEAHASTEQPADVQPAAAAETSAPDDGVAAEPAPEPEPALEPESTPEPTPEPASEPDAAPEPAAPLYEVVEPVRPGQQPRAAGAASAAQEEPTNFLAHDAEPDLLDPVTRLAPAAEPASATPATTAVDADDDIDDDIDDLERTRIVRRPETGERFVLQFSTGESVMVFGSGLVGRNPLLQPGEPLDQIVVISDPSKSVSKTHLEFGQEQGSFWVNDRFSANGTIVREPETPARRCEPGRRYRIVRGTRVDIGEQFFIVS